MSRTRTRRVAKWVGVVVCVAIGAAWVGSYWYAFGHAWLRSHGRWVIKADYGKLYFTRRSPRQHDPSGWVFHVSPGPQPWWRWYKLSYERIDSVIVLTLVVPLWIPFVLAALPAAYVWYGDRRHPPGHCRRCGYNLTGNTSGVCPECGTKVETP